MMKSNKKKSLAIPMVGGVFAFLDLRLVLKNESWFLTVRRRKQRFWRSWLLYRRYFSYHKESETLFLLWFHRATAPVRIKKERKNKTFLLFFFGSILQLFSRRPFQNSDASSSSMRETICCYSFFSYRELQLAQPIITASFTFELNKCALTKCREIFLFLLLVNQQLHLNSL